MDVWPSFRQRKSRSVKREMRFVENRVILSEQKQEGVDEY